MPIITRQLGRFGIQNGEAAAKTMTIDYVVAAVER